MDWKPQALHHWKQTQLKEPQAAQHLSGLTHEALADYLWAAPHRWPRGLCPPSLKQ